MCVRARAREVSLQRCAALRRAVADDRACLLSSLTCVCVTPPAGQAGSTRHGEEMGATCSPIFKALELEYGKPVGMGIIGPGATAEQAAKRVAYAGNATRAAIRLARHMAAMAMSGLAADAEVTETA